MGHPLGLTLRLATGGYLGLTPPCLLVLKNLKQTRSENRPIRRNVWEGTQE